MFSKSCLPKPFLEAHNSSKCEIGAENKCFPNSTQSKQRGLCICVRVVSGYVTVYCFHYVLKFSTLKTSVVVDHRVPNTCFGGLTPRAIILVLAA